jgi:excisionase family DNA binding protein
MRSRYATLIDQSGVAQQRRRVPDEFLTVVEVAGLLKLNQQTIRNMIDWGQLGAVRVGQETCPGARVAARWVPGSW